MKLITVRKKNNENSQNKTKRDVLFGGEPA